MKELISVVEYNSDSPSGLRWLVNAGRRGKVGNAVGSLQSEGYWVFKYNKKTYRAHRVVYFLLNPKSVMEGLVVDHIDRNPSNNKIENLRLCTETENHYNRWRKGTKLKGTTRSGNRWLAQIQVGGKKMHLGRFDSQLEAHMAYAEAAQKYHGEFKNIYG